MKAQGLSIRFIVLLAIGILVLILIALFVFTGIGPGKNTVNRQNALNTCKELCAEDENMVMNRQGTTGVVDAPLGYKPRFCGPHFNIKGIGNDVTCDQLYSCTLQDADGDICTLNCTTTACNCEGSDMNCE